MFHSIGDKYLRAVAEVAGSIPIMIPALDAEFDLEALLDRLDGVMMTGAVSNVHPPHYGAVATERHEPYDHRRDRLTLNSIAQVIERGMPLLCICRGFQELNVVLGGTLATELQELPGRLDHRAPRSPDIAMLYAPAHPIAITPGGQLEQILGKRETLVNTLHRQELTALRPRLRSRQRPPTGRSKPSRSRERAVSPWASSGTPNTRPPTIPIRSSSLWLSALPPAPMPPWPRTLKARLVTG